jgi:acetoin utilization deacetylase AcuC-like enzyme
MRLSTGQFGRLTALVAAAADECCGGRLVAMTEGGYDLNALAGSLRATIRVLGGEASLDAFPAPAGPTPRADVTLNAVRPHLTKYWQI